jgi:hypothetical protein
MSCRSVAVWHASCACSHGGDPHAAAARRLANSPIGTGSLRAALCANCNNIVSVILDLHAIVAPQRKHWRRPRPATHINVPHTNHTTRALKTHLGSRLLHLGLLGHRADARRAVEGGLHLAVRDGGERQQIWGYEEWRCRYMPNGSCRCVYYSCACVTDQRGVKPACA